MTIELSEYVIDAIADAIVKKMQVPTKEEKALLQKWHDNRGISMKDFEDAMDALEQEPCGDAISRQAVLDALCDGCELLKNGEQTCFTKCEEYHFLATLPPVIPQPKTDVLDKIRAEIEEKYGDYDICEWFEDYDYEENDVSEYRSVGSVSDILEIIDKYKAEREDKE